MCSIHVKCTHCYCCYCPPKLLHEGPLTAVTRMLEPTAVSTEQLEDISEGPWEHKKWKKKKKRKEKKEEKQEEEKEGGRKRRRRRNIM